jgi:hypothetical protein
VRLVVGLAAGDARRVEHQPHALLLQQHVVTRSSAAAQEQRARAEPLSLEAATEGRLHGGSGGPESRLVVVRGVRGGAEGRVVDGEGGQRGERGRGVTRTRVLRSVRLCRRARPRDERAAAGHRGAATRRLVQTQRVVRVDTRREIKTIHIKVKS